MVAAIDKHRAWLEASGELARRRTRRARDEIEAIAVPRLRDRWGDVHGAHRSSTRWPPEGRSGGVTDPYAAADELLEDL